MVIPEESNTKYEAAEVSQFWLLEQQKQLVNSIKGMVRGLRRR